MATVHLVRRYPARGIKLGFNLLATHLLCDIGDAQPKHTDRGWPVTGLVVHSELDFIRFVDVDVEGLVLLPIYTTGLRSRFNCVFDLDDHECLRSPGEPRHCSVIDIPDSLNSHGQESSQWLAHVGCTQAFICGVSVLNNCMVKEGPYHLGMYLLNPYPHGGLHIVSTPA